MISSWFCIPFTISLLWSNSSWGSMGDAVEIWLVWVDDWSGTIGAGVWVSELEIILFASSFGFCTAFYWLNLDYHKYYAVTFF